MRSESWQELETLFDSVLEQPEGRRESFLARHCSDPELRREIDRLLAADARRGEFLEGSALADHGAVLEADPELGEAPENLVGRRVGGYRLVEVLGRGGMGAVYLAEQTQPFERQVALKLIRSDLAGRGAAARFRAEGRALARLSHPHVAQVYEAGVAEGGVPYLVMELVPGEPLTVYCDRKRLGIDARLELFRQICRGVQHLHQRAVIHRDLKPANLLVMEEGGRPLPKIIDLGIARALDRSPGDVGAETALFGTPAYLGPEALDPDYQLDTRQDIYSLGVVLCEVLFGARPRSAPGGDPLQRFRELGTKAREELAALRGLRPWRLERLIRGDLGAIVTKATAVDVDARFSSAAELEADLLRFSQHRPVAARPPTLLYRLHRLLRRRALVLAAGLAVVLALFAGLVLRTLESRRANLEAEATRQVVDYLINMFQLSDPSEALGDTVTAKELLVRGENMVQRDLRHQPLLRARLQDTIGRVYLQLGVYDRARPVLEDALATRIEQLGIGHPDVVTSETRLAEALIALGDFELARAHARSALAGAENLGDEGPRQVLSALLLLVNVEIMQGDTDAADLYLQRALELSRSAGWENSPEHIETLDHLGWLSSRRGRQAEAERLFRQTLEMSREILPPDHPEIASHLYYLGVGLLNRQELGEETEAILLEALEIREEILGSEHPEVADCLHSLASLYQLQRRLDEAEAFELRALEIRASAYPDGHSSVALSANNLAQIYHLQEDFEGAEALYRRAIEVWEATMGPDHDLLASSLTNLAELYLDLEKPEAAHRMLQRAVRILEGSLGPRHPYLGHPVSGLGRAALALGDRRAAESHLARAVSIWDAAADYRHPAIAEIRALYESVRGSVSDTPGVPEPGDGPLEDRFFPDR